MTQSWLAALLGVGGLIIGAYLEPLKLQFAQGAKNHEMLIERCATIVANVHDSVGYLHQINVHLRYEGTCTDELRETHSKARDDLCRTVALIDLNGPDELVESAHAVLAAMNATTGHAFAGVGSQTGSHPAGLREPSPEFRQAVEGLDLAVDGFVRAARPFARPPRVWTWPSLPRAFARIRPDFPRSHRFRRHQLAHESKDATGEVLDVVGDHREPLSAIPPAPLVEGPLHLDVEPQEDVQVLDRRGGGPGGEQLSEVDPDGSV